MTLLLKLRNRIADAEPGTIMRVIATDPAAPLDLPAWCHMTGHNNLCPVPGDRPVYALRLTADARRTGPTRRGAGPIADVQRPRARLRSSPRSPVPDGIDRSEPLDHRPQRGGEGIELIGGHVREQRGGPRVLRDRRHGYSGVGRTL
ncbi:sulfurtransferase TusA family protein [Streptomyces sp. NBC_00210]|uniref:sulfurtransferase TusA family protein n=1 Tax=unclassified Streptomyces TaxID=2593676 RepID=UPI003243B183